MDENAQNLDFFAPRPSEMEFRSPATFSQNLILTTAIGNIT
jgi:hypothetical protein